MVIGVDTMSSILDFQDRDTCVIFGDGGGGAILQPTEEKYGIILPHCIILPSPFIPYHVLSEE